MKADWEVKALGSQCSVLTKGTTPTSVGFKFQETGINFVKVESITEAGNFIAQKFAKIGPEAHEALKRSQLKTGDILFSIAGALGRTAIVDQTVIPANTNQALAIMRLSEEAEVSKEFLRYFLTSELMLDQIEKLKGGAAQQNLSLGQLRALEIPLPPLEEQKRIVAVLDAAFEGLTRARTHIETNLQNARELFDRIANGKLTNSTANEVTLDEVASIPSSLVDPRLPEHIDQPHVGAGNMETGRDVLVDVKTSREESLKSGKYTFDGSMVLYSKIRPYLRKVGRPDFVGLCSADMYPLLPNGERLNKSYLFHLLMSDDFTEYAISGSDRAGMPKVNQTHLFKYRFRLPSLLDQLAIVEIIDRSLEESEALQAHYRTKLQDLDDLRQSLLQRAFAGELT